MEQNKIKFKDFPEKLKQRVLEIRKKQYSKSWIKHEQRILDNHSLINCFRFNLTDEGIDYWLNVYCSNDFSDFKDSKIIKKDKVIKLSDQTLKINSVEDKNGSVYMIGDTIRVFEKSCGSYNQVFKILKFRWNVDKTHICAVTSKHSNGIRLDWIEHYIEKPKFVLPEKWCVRNVNNIIADYFNNKVGFISKIYNNKIHYYRFLHSEDDAGNNVLKHEKIRAEISYNYIRPDFIEITFEQFKQYVLFDGYKIGDKINTLSATNAVITDLQYINGQSVAFFKLNNGVSGNWCRVLIKNIIK